MFKKLFLPKKLSTRELSTLAMLVAITAVLAIFGTFRFFGPAIKIPTKFVSVFITGVFFGPVAAGLVAATGDILNVFLAPSGGAWIPQLTLVEFLYGFVYGIMFYRRSFKGVGYVTRAVICVLIQVGIDLFITTSILVSCKFFSSFAVGVGIRLPASIIKGILQAVVLFAGMGYLDIFKKEIERNSFKSYANSFQTVSKLGLERIETLLGFMGNPQEKLKCIQVAGTNGKGSVVAFLQAILTNAGYKTGKFISPNMVKVNERVCIDGKEIGDSDLSRILGKIEKFSKKVEKQTGNLPTQFEIWTAAAFAYFAEQKCDYVVLETGMGGRFDATNVVKKNVLSIITRIDLDHMEYLGDTIEKIAFEKAGIIKAGSPVLSVKQMSGALDVIQKRADELGSTFTLVNAPEEGTHSDIYEFYDDGGIHVQLGLGGVHQLENAALAVAAAGILNIDKKYIIKGLESAVNPGRFEMTDKNTVFDGAHNPNGTVALVKNLNKYFPNREKVYIMAAMKDKDIKGNLRILSETDGEFRFVAVKDNSRSASAEELQKIAKEAGITGEVYNSLKDAFKDTKGKLVVICGSLYLYKDYKEIK
ncbi:MAG: folate family ECF transporter S component [Bacillota bacterium]|nr:folate family ECF transporter S component [Bacillota bacterium]